MNHYADPHFWTVYAALPGSVQRLADKSFHLLKPDPCHPSLHLKRVGRYCSARVGQQHRALTVEGPDGLIWFWIGSHAAYDRLIG